MGSSSATFEVEVHYYSADLVVGFTLLWGFITAIQTTTKAYRNDDFVFVTNRLVSNLSNTLFLMTASVVGGITAILSNYVLKLIINLFMKGSIALGMQGGASPLLLLLGILTTSLYILLFCGLGYLVGTLVQISKLFVVLLPALFIGSVFYAGSTGTTGMVEDIFQFYFTESSLLLFMIKVLMTVVLFFCRCLYLF